MGCKRKLAKNTVMHECPPLAIDEMLSPIQLARATNSRFIPGRHFSLLEYEFLETIQPGGWDVLVAMAPRGMARATFSVVLFLLGITLPIHTHAP